MRGAEVPENLVLNPTSSSEGWANESLARDESRNVGNGTGRLVLRQTPVPRLVSESPRWMHSFVPHRVLIHDSSTDNNLRA